MDELRILLARHGHATSGPDHRWTKEDPLTEIGLRQADELAAHIAAMRRPPDRIVASSATRARQTAEACGRALGLEVQLDDRLLEFGSGAISPFTLTEMFELMPYDAIWHPQDAAYDGEPVGEFWLRTAEAIEDVITAGGQPLVVSHGGTTTAILRHLVLLDRGTPDAIHFYVANAGLSDVRVRNDRYGNRRVLLTRLNDTRFLTDVTEV